MLHDSRSGVRAQGVRIQDKHSPIRDPSSGDLASHFREFRDVMYAITYGWDFDFVDWSWFSVYNVVPTLGVRHVIICPCCRTGISKMQNSRPAGDVRSNHVLLFPQWPLGGHGVRRRRPTR